VSACFCSCVVGFAVAPRASVPAAFAPPLGGPAESHPHRTALPAAVKWKTNPKFGRKRAQAGEQSAGAARPAALDRGVLLQLWKSVVDATGEGGRSLSELFAQLPPRKEYPDYYSAIAKPFALSTMRRKIDGGKYSRMHELRADMELMVSNAKTYNLPGSVVVQVRPPLTLLC
jgi:hypothetical protein